MEVIKVNLTLKSKKGKRYVIIFLTLTITIMATGILGFTSSEKETMMNEFYQSVNYDPDRNLLSFTIPKTVPEGYKFYLHVSARIFMGDKSSGMSLHIFDDESLNYTWVKGKTYTYPLISEGVDFISLTYGFVDENKNETLYTIHISSDGTKVIDDNGKSVISSSFIME